MKGQEFVYLCFWQSIVAIDIRKLLSHGLKTVCPGLIRIKPEKAISYDAENLPKGMGFCVDGSNLFLVGGEWMKRGLRCWVRDKSRGNQGVSSTLYMADLSQPILKFSKLGEFEGTKFASPVVVKNKESIYAMSCRLETKRAGNNLKILGLPFFEAYNIDSGSITTPPPPPFLNNRMPPPSPEVYGHAVVENTLFLYVFHHYCFYHFDSGTWMPEPPHGCGLLNYMYRHYMDSDFCNGKFVSEDVLISLEPGNMRAVLFPPVGSDEEPIYQRLNSVEDDLARAPSELCESVVLNLGEKKMCAIFLCPPIEGQNYTVYIYIFQVSKLVEPQHGKDFLSVTCLHKGFYHLDDPVCDLPRLDKNSPILELIGAFYVRDGKCVSSSVSV